jgi:hypothetical protein
MEMEEALSSLLKSIYELMTTIKQFKESDNKQLSILIDKAESASEELKTLISDTIVIYRNDCYERWERNNEEF